MLLSKEHAMALVSQTMLFEKLTEYAMHVYYAGMKRKDESRSFFNDTKSEGK